MIYEFIDTVTTANEADLILPAEAVSINGEYLEEMIDGYTTLYTSGRESLAKEINTTDTKHLNGSFVQGSRFPARTIKVGFQLLAEDAEGLMEKFLQLNDKLNVEDAEIIFNDEQDKFFVGSPVMNAEVSKGRCNVTGEYEIQCFDPFKYSTRLFAAEPEDIETEDDPDVTEKVILIDYQGTYPAHPILEADFYSELPVEESKSVVESEWEFYYSTSDEEATGGSWGEWLDEPEEDEYAWRRLHRIYADETDDYYPDEGGELVPEEEPEPEPDPETQGDEDEDLGDDADCSFVAFVDERENIIQAGYVGGDEEPGEENQTLVNSKWTNSGNWNATMQAAWITNNGPTPSSGYLKQGSFSEQYGGYYTNKQTTSGKLTGTHTSTKKTVTTKDKQTNKEIKKDWNQLKITKITAKASNRTTSGVTLTLTIPYKALLPIEKKAVLKGVLTVNGTDKAFTIKSSGKEWAKGKSGTLTPSIKISGLSTSTAKLSSIKFKMTCTGGSGGGTISSVTCSSLPIPTYAPPKTNGYFLKPTYNTGQTGKYTGPTIFRTIPEDSAHEYGAAYFRSDFSTMFSIGKDANDSQQCGSQFILFTGANNTIHYAIIIDKTAAGKKAKVTAKSGSTELLLGYLDVSYKKTCKVNTGTKNVTVKGKNGKTTYFNKTTYKTETYVETTYAGSVEIVDGFVKFTYGNLSGQLLTVAENHEVTGIVFGCMQYSNKPPMQFNGVKECTFVKKFCDTEAYIPNPFTAGDVLVIDTGSAAIELNDVRRMSLGALGNDYETFTLLPGMNQIKPIHSDMENDDYAPAFKMKYREVYL